MRKATRQMLIDLGIEEAELERVEQYRGDFKIEVGAGKLNWNQAARLYRHYDGDAAGTAGDFDVVLRRHYKNSQSSPASTEGIVQILLAKPSEEPVGDL